MSLPDAIFELEMYKMHLRPGLCRGPHWGSLQRSPDSVDGLTEGRLKGSSRSLFRKVWLRAC